MIIDNCGGDLKISGDKEIFLLSILFPVTGERVGIDLLKRLGQIIKFFSSKKTNI